MQVYISVWKKNFSPAISAAGVADSAASEKSKAASAPL